MARLQNTYAVSPTDPLSALVNHITGLPIENMPADSQSITQLSGNDALYLPRSYL